MSDATPTPGQAARQAWKDAWDAAPQAGRGTPRWDSLAYEAQCWEAAAEAAHTALAAERDAARELLDQAAGALWEMAKTALTVKPNLDQPYPDAPEWTPWTRWMEPRARRAHDLKVKIRQYLKARDEDAAREALEARL